MTGWYSVLIDGKPELVEYHKIELYRALHPDMEVLRFVRDEPSGYDGGTEDWVQQLCGNLRKWTRKIFLAHP